MEFLVFHSNIDIIDFYRFLVSSIIEMGFSFECFEKLLLMFSCLTSISLCYLFTDNRFILKFVPLFLFSLLFLSCLH